MRAPSRPWAAVLVGLLIVLTSQGPFGQPSSVLSAPMAPATPSPEVEAAAAALDSPLGYTVYDERLADGWSSWSWDSAIDLGAHDQPYSGARAAAWKANAAWAGFYLHFDGGLDTTGFTHLSLALRASRPEQRVALQLYDELDRPIGDGVPLADYGGHPPVGAWRRYKVPLTELGAARRRINGLVLQEHAGQVQPTLWIDRVGLLGAAAATAPRPAAERYRRGVNLAGAEFGPIGWVPPGHSRLPGKHEQDYIYPTPAELDYFNRKGLTLIRLPFRWERMQRRLFGPLDTDELRRMDRFVAAARARGMRVILDPHNFARYYDKVIGTPAVPNAAFADFWRKLAAHYRTESAIWAYGLVNEPADTGGRWPAAAQAAVNAIRSVDRDHLILVPGDGWSQGTAWPWNNANLRIHDPANNFMYEAHQYFDRDHSGTYRESYDASGAYPNIGVDRIRPFVNWLRDRNARGFVGEYGIPDHDPRWLTVLDNFLTYLDANGIGGTYWAAGPWWHDYPLSVEPRGGRDRPQMAVLTRHLGTVR